MAEDEPNSLHLDYSKIQHFVTEIATAIAGENSQLPPGTDPVALRAEYQSTIEMIKLLSDLRFRCLVFVTAIVTVANAISPGTVDAGTRMAMGCVGFLATLGITVYELRNSILYEAAVHRATVLEKNLRSLKGDRWSPRDGGLFTERPLYVNSDYWRGRTDQERKLLAAKPRSIRLMSFWLVKVKHDRGLALIYGAALGGWVFLIASGFLSLPALNWSPSLPPGWDRVIAGLLGLITFLVAERRFKWHDENRYRPEAPPSPG